MTSDMKGRLWLASAITWFFLLCVVLSLTQGCATTRYTMEQLWPANADGGSVLVVQWPEGVAPEDITTDGRFDPVTETTRTQSGVLWTAPLELE